MAPTESQQPNVADLASQLQQVSREMGRIKSELGGAGGARGLQQEIDELKASGLDNLKRELEEIEAQARQFQTSIPEHGGLRSRRGKAAPAEEEESEPEQSWGEILLMIVVLFGLVYVGTYALSMYLVHTSEQDQS
mmetsp:Transcript_20505/g.52036  ORF Transcript_20505/g.52036 Transcript_20505/m.52036 type:complete len:136 (-) Transcript_20505:15-422(-)